MVTAKSTFKTSYNLSMSFILHLSPPQPLYKGSWLCNSKNKTFAVAIVNGNLPKSSLFIWALLSLQRKYQGNLPKEHYYPRLFPLGSQTMLVNLCDFSLPPRVIILPSPATVLLIKHRINSAFLISTTQIVIFLII